MSAFSGLGRKFTDLQILKMFGEAKSVLEGKVRACACDRGVFTLLSLLLEATVHPFL